MTENADLKTIEGFGEEWSAFDQTKLQGKEFDSWFEAYFKIFPFDHLPPEAEGFDLGCGSGRWAIGVAPRVGTLHCIDPAPKALNVAKRRLEGNPNVHFHLAPANAIPLEEESQDFGYSLGVLHHIPDTAAAMTEAVKLLKPGAPFLVYLYYRFDERPAWFVSLWRISDRLRRDISHFPFSIRRRVTDLIALAVYWPLSRLALIVDKAGGDVTNFPLSAYRRSSLYTMRTDALDRFGTPLEHRFSRPEIERMMKSAGLQSIRFSDNEPFWIAVGIKR